jgi:phenylpropionate dioxygenase-like ring-hydroxylating dioxygenase large terminal subunit
MTFLRNAWYMAMWAEQLPPETVAPRTMLGEPLVMYRTGDGVPQAMADICPHRHAPLHLGKVVGGERLRCPYHGLEFDRTGACVHNPNGPFTVPPAAVRTYPAVERHSIVWVWMGAPGQADPSAIPDFSILEPKGDGPRIGRDWIRMKADYRLIADNPLDLCHVSFLHEGILGNETTREAPTRLTRDGNHVLVQREMLNVPPPKMFDLLFNRDGKPVDMYANMHWDPPGCLMNDVRVNEPGAPPEEGTGVFGFHFLTPESESSTLYHFTAVRQNPRPFPPEIAAEIAEQISELRRVAFQEQDAPLLEAQQRNQAALGPGAAPPALFNVDVGIVAYRRILDQLIAKEAA